MLSDGIITTVNTEGYEFHYCPECDDLRIVDLCAVDADRHLIGLCLACLPERETWIVSAIVEAEHAE